MLDAIEEIAPNRRKEVNSMKVAIPFLAALLLVSGFVGNGSAGEMNPYPEGNAHFSYKLN